MKKITLFLLTVFVPIGIDVCALQKLKDSDYMKTVYQFDREIDTKLAVLSDAYSPNDGSLFIVGFKVWKKDSLYLTGSEFYSSTLDRATLTDKKHEFELWHHVTSSGYLSICPGLLRHRARRRIKSMQKTYEGWLVEGSSNFEFVEESIEKLTLILKMDSVAVSMGY